MRREQLMFLDSSVAGRSLAGQSSIWMFVNEINRRKMDGRSGMPAAISQRFVQPVRVLIQS